MVDNQDDRINTDSPQFKKAMTEFVSRDRSYFNPVYGPKVMQLFITPDRTDEILINDAMIRKEQELALKEQQRHLIVRVFKKLLFWRRPPKTPRLIPQTIGEVMLTFPRIKWCPTCHQISCSCKKNAEE